MASKNQVTLTLAGDASKLEQTFDKVGQSSKKLADDVGSSSRRMADETGDAYGRVDEAAGNTYDKFDALESVGRGTTDTMSGLSEIMSGNVLQGSTDLAGGVAALADGFSGALLPAIKAATQGGIQNAAAIVRQTAANVAGRGAALAGAAATNVMTVAQKALNLAMRLNPIGLVITALVLLGTGLVVAYKKSETFRNIVNGAFGKVRDAAVYVFNWIKDNWPYLLGLLAGPFGLAAVYILKHRDKFLGYIQAVPGAIGKAFKTVGSAIAAPFIAGFNAIRNAWNNTVGGKGFSIPGWVPNLGGKEFRIPYFHSGGIVSGAMGSESLAVLRAGERVTGGSNSGGPVTVVLKGDGSRAARALLELLRQAIQATTGGDVVAALGR